MLRGKKKIIIALIQVIFMCLIFEGGYSYSIEEDPKIIYIHSNIKDPEIPEYIQLASDAFGIQIIPVTFEKFIRSRSLEKIKGIIIKSDFPVTEIDRLRYYLSKLSKDIDVMLTGIERDHQTLLHKLGLPVQIESYVIPTTAAKELIVHPSLIASFFSGMRIACYLLRKNSIFLPDSKRIISFADDGESSQFIVKKSEGGRIYFLLAETQAIMKKPLLESDNLLLESLPYLVYFKKVGGFRVWQGSGLFANLAIDDPFLIEPYGNLSFEGLKNEMEKHNYHTTISFIPRNYKRNELNVVSIFRNRPDLFSIAVHGNNHDRREFYRYSRKNILEPFSLKTLKEQEFNLAQALIRMDEFKRITGIQYDPIMIFPQDASPAPTLRVCKQLGYLATINGSNIPLDEAVPRQIKLSYRLFNTLYYGFLNIKRTNIKYYSEIRIRTDLFLGNPLLFYSHHNLFEKDIGAFNSTVDLIKRICPQVRWISLGSIVKQWYLWRINKDGVYEVLMLSPNCQIKNNNTKRIKYKIIKYEDEDSNILTIKNNDKIIQWQRDGKKIFFFLDLFAGETSELKIQYDSVVSNRFIKIDEGNSISIILWRGLAEFRDRVLSKTFVGRYARDIFYESGVVLWFPIILFAAIISFLSMMIILRIRKVKNKNRERNN